MLQQLLLGRQTSKAANILASSKRMLIFTGAGISASAGIPTFRDTDGLWTNEYLAFFGFPEAWKIDPWRCWNMYEKFRVSVATAQPTTSHWLVSLLEEQGGATTFTSNVDSLHLKSSSNAKEIHGCLRHARCMACKEVVFLPEEMSQHNPACPSCGNWLRHDVVLWDEQIRHTEELADSLEQSDTLLLIGASGDVTDVEGMARRMRERGKKIIEINPNPTSATSLVTLHFGHPADVVLPMIVKKLLNIRR